MRLSFIFYRFSYITSLIENAPEGTSLNFEGGLNVIEDLDKVSRNEPYSESMCNRLQTIRNGIITQDISYNILRKIWTNTFIDIVKLDHISTVNLCLNKKFTMQRRQIIAISRYNRRKKIKVEMVFQRKCIQNFTNDDNAWPMCFIQRYYYLHVRPWWN